jgi:hypothetical protein
MTVHETLRIRFRTPALLAAGIVIREPTDADALEEIYENVEITSIRWYKIP